MFAQTAQNCCILDTVQASKNLFVFFSNLEEVCMGMTVHPDRYEFQCDGHHSNRHQCNARGVIYFDTELCMHPETGEYRLEPIPPKNLYSVVLYVNEVFAERQRYPDPTANSGSWPVFTLYGAEDAPSCYCGSCEHCRWGGTGAGLSWG